MVAGSFNCIGTMIYVIPMFLGRTYDMRKDGIGIDIFNKADIDYAMDHPIDTSQVTSQYRLISTSQDKKDLLDVNAEISIKLKTDFIKISGSGRYMKETINSENTIQIAVYLTFATRSVELNPDTEPMQYWRSLKPEDVGTHYVRRMTYGGHILATVNFVALKQEYMTNITAAVELGMSKSGTFDVNAQGNLQMVAKNLSSMASIEIKYYATVTLSKVPTDIDGFLSLVRNFSEEVEKTGDGHGVPICVELTELSRFDTKFSFLKNTALLDNLDDFDEKFENVRVAKMRLKSWLADLPAEISEKDEEKIVDFSERLTKVMKVFYEVIGSMNIESGPEQLDPADQAFNQNTRMVGSNSYTKELKQLIQDVVLEDSPDAPRSVYTYWGGLYCPAATKMVYSGYMASTIVRGVGGGYNYQCLPKDPQWLPDNFKKEEMAQNSVLGGTKYKAFTVFKDEGEQIEGSLGSCSLCQAPFKPTVRVFSSTTECPESWRKEYSGFIVSSKRHRSESICVDYNPGSYPAHKQCRKDPFVMPITTGLEDESKRTALACVVCTK